MSTTISTDRRHSDFSERLKEAFKTAKPAEIARKLGITYQGAKNYLDGRIPAPDTLVEISRSTGYSIHWLLTGTGPKLATNDTLTGEGAETVSQNNGSSPQADAEPYHQRKEIEQMGSEVRVLTAQMQLLIEQNNLVIGLLRQLVEKSNA